MKKDAALVVLLVAISTAGFAQPSVITFDDMPTAQGHIPNGYFGLNWRLECLDAADYRLNPSGYLAGLVSSNFVAFGFASTTPVGISSSNPLR